MCTRYWIQYNCYCGPKFVEFAPCNGNPSRMDMDDACSRIWYNEYADSPEGWCRRCLSSYQKDERDKYRVGKPYYNYMYKKY